MLSNPEPGFRVSRCGIDTTNRFLTYLTESDENFFQLPTPGLTSVSLLKSESGFEFVTQLADTRKRRSSHL